MENQTFRPELPTLWPIRVKDKVKLATWIEPSISVHYNISLVWKILENLVEGWNQVVAEYQQELDVLSAEQTVESFILTQDIQPHFIQCLFSYITFFFILESGYKAIYSSLNGLNLTLELYLTHDKLPQWTKYIRKLRLIRNNSTAHFAGAEKANDLNSISGAMWEPWWTLKDTGVVDLASTQFGGSGVSRQDPVTGEIQQSSDRQIGPISEVHRQCTEFIAQYDLLCTDYMKRIKANLPMTLGNRIYSNPEGLKMGKPWIW